MTVILVLLTFVTFLVIDHFYSKSKQRVLQVAPEATKREPLPRLAPSLVGGFAVPENLRYHPGHAWALSESPNLVRIGVDDFAAKVAGKIEGVTLPQRGQWIRQGQKVWSFKRNGKTVDMISPIEGSVADVNDAVISDPSLMARDPYGEGWMITVQSPDSKTNFKNLLGGALARWWTEESASRLQKRLPNMVPAMALAQDGGVAIGGVTDSLNDEDWQKTAREFFLS